MTEQPHTEINPIAEQLGEKEEQPLPSPEQQKMNRMEVMDMQTEQLATISIQNAIACSVLLSRELCLFIDPGTGKPTGERMTATKAETLASLAAAAKDSREVV